MTILTDDPTSGVYNIIADQGSTLSRTFTWTDSNGSPVNLTGYTARMKVRKIYPATLLVSAHADSPVISITSASEITITALTGTLDVVIPATTMAAVTPGFYEYDLEVVSGGGEVTKISRGKFEVRAEATY